MSKELMTTDQQTKVTDAELTMHLENLGLLKDLSTGEKNSYLQIAKAFNLNPFKREIHVSKYNGQMSIITGYEVYIKRAERTGQLDGWGVTTQGEVAKGDLKAIVTIHRKDRSHPFIWEALYSEYVQKTKEGAVTKFWQKASTMIKKVAISQAFRLCFSDELGGMPYTSDEVSTEDVSHEVVNTASKQTPPSNGKPAISEKQFTQLSKRIADSESQEAAMELLKKAQASFTVTDEQAALIVNSISILPIPQTT